MVLRINQLEKETDLKNFNSQSIPKCFQQLINAH